MRFVKIIFILLNLFSFLSLTHGQLTMGLISYSEESFDGYTLFSPINFRYTYLIDNCGNVINTWEAQHEAGMMAYLDEEGSLIRAARIPSTFNAGGSGGRIEKYSWEGERLWQYDVNSLLEQQHHDIEVLPNGNVLVLSWDLYTENQCISHGRRPELIPNGGVWCEKVMELKPIGPNEAELVWEWKVWDHLVQEYDFNLANYGSIQNSPHKIDFNYVLNPNVASNDWLHCNSIDYNPELDQVMLSSRNFNEIWVISHDSLHISNGDLLYRWGNPMSYQRGEAKDRQLFNQHDAHWIEPDIPGEGNIMIFNNGIGREDGLYSKVIEIEPPVTTDGNYFIEDISSFDPVLPLWEYPELPNLDFFASRISGSQRLKNGNTLICSGREGYIFEVDQDENIVWEYISPVNGAGPNEQGSMVFGNDLFRAHRYAPDFPAFLGRIISPSGPIELSSLNQDCVSLLSNHDELSNIQIEIYPNPSSSFISIAGIQDEFKLSLFDLNGYSILEKNISSDEMLDLNTLQSGIYILSFSNKKGKIILKKLITKI